MKQIFFICKLLFLFGLFITANSIHAQNFTIKATLGENHIVKRKPRVATTNLTELLSLPSATQGVAVEYYDGLGRPMQTINVDLIPDSKEKGYLSKVAWYIFDEDGRETLHLLPFSWKQKDEGGAYINEPLIYSATFYGSQYPRESMIFSNTVYDKSPLNRIVEQSGPGGSWGLHNGHTVTTEYEANAANEVTRWRVSSSGTLRGGDFYRPGTLYRTRVKNEDGIFRLEYKDLEGRIVRKVADVSGVKATTDYVYDDFGRLRWVLPPKYMASLDANGTPNGIPAGVTLVQGAQELKNTTSQAKYALASGASLTLLPNFVAQPGFSITQGSGTESLTALAYYYAYDGYGRMIEKRLPGVDPVYMVYDGRNRLVAVQDGELRKAGRWLYTRYDALNRSVETGYLTNGLKTQLSMQQAVIAAFVASPQYDTPSGNEYTRNSFPRVIGGVCKDGTLDALTYTFYDSYTHGGAADLSGGKVYGQLVASNVTGLPTVSRVKELTAGTWSTTGTYYDERGRVIQTIKKGLYGGKADDAITVSSKLNFVGQVDTVKEVQTFNGLTNTLERSYRYYDSGQLWEVKAQLNGGAVETLASYTYDALGRVQQKSYGGIDQKQKYGYNIRGWLTDINNPSTTTDLFAMKLGYDTPEVAGAGVVGQYGGNISSMVWRTKMVDGTQDKKGYGFAYDGLDRLKGSSYATFDAAGTATASEAYTESIPSYDENGNIKTLLRKDGSKVLTSYSYSYNGNQLDRINGGAPYGYDANGNATTDGRSGFTVAYNELNLPKSVSKGTQSVSYTYDATGAKLAVTNPDNTARYYHGSMVYDKDKKLELVLHEEGTIKATTSGSSTTYAYQYNLKDHLGNTRAMFSKAAGAGQAPVLAQATDYYPFGKSFENNNVTKNRYLYNGKELQDQVIGGTPFGWYDYGARFYDPELGVFHTMDPLAERFSFQSPFAYAANNPIIYIDKDGKGPLLGFLIGAGAEYGVQVIKNFRSGHGWNSFGHNISYTKIAIAGLAGAVTSGFSALNAASKTTITLATTSPIASISVGELSATIIPEVSAGVLNQAVDNQNTNKPLTEGVVEAGMTSMIGSILGEATSAIRSVIGIPEIKRLTKRAERTADRAARVGSNSSNEAAAEASKELKTANTVNEAASTAISSTVSAGASNTSAEIAKKTEEELNNK